MNETEILIGHLKDLADQSYSSNMFTFTNFLGESDQALLFSMKKDLDYAGLTLWGGAEGMSRCIARFGRPDDLGYDLPFPITCLKVEPLIARFGEELSHRDYLGALMNLGIEREMLGDIAISGKNAYVFCVDHIADYIRENLEKVRHTNVKVTVLEEVPEVAKPKLEEVNLIVASERLDAVVARLYNLSRSQSQELFSAKKIFVNGRQCENNSGMLKPGDSVSVRGFGKFIFERISGVTGKGRYHVLVNVYR